MSNHISTTLKYMFLVPAGLGVILLSSLMRRVAAPEVGEYYYSTFLRNNYSILTGCMFFIVGLAIGLFSKLNPLFSGALLILVFPLASIFEGLVYDGSHNLIPFEFIFHFILSLPAVLGVYIGRFLTRFPHSHK